MMSNYIREREIARDILYDKRICIQMQQKTNLRERERKSFFGRPSILKNKGI